MFYFANNESLVERRFLSHGAENRETITLAEWQAVYGG